MTIRKAAATAASPIPGGCCIQLNQPNYVNRGFVKHYPVGPEWDSPDKQPMHGRDHAQDEPLSPVNRAAIRATHESLRARG